MKIKELRKLKQEDVDKKYKQIVQELMILRGQAATSTPPKNPGQIKQIRRTIAQIKTLQKEKEIQDKITEILSQKNKGGKK